MAEPAPTSIQAMGGAGTTPPEYWENSYGELWLGTLEGESILDIGILIRDNGRFGSKSYQGGGY